MSTEKNRIEANRWLHTADDDLDSAIILKENSKFAHSCFHAQQAAKKALKAVWYHSDADPWGHSIKRLIDDLESIDLGLRDIQKFLQTGDHPGPVLHSDKKPEWIARHYSGCCL